mmetsp:Transcript_38671/g.95946  ORF Transcript_38671/g.95946 Transcript_38671/m.95946 type:complete len:170 (+) Transcript_38671:94-603(+)|eukprot:CAMPEP_0197575876 /NCGR_PEP_ID=MMETSP1326-20131121/1105_1 /TAXON_ID=1155430 /ORGANISM="Genus nov. species nov., Strain RCC2288" /LENGTH=169 /DNA_ID=CAMNT_0043138707 /DNA_START=91 /DNA_END=600 /DNA_ORIENTATION=-
MPPKGGAPEPEAKIFYLRCTGGESAPAAVLAPKVGSLGVPPKKVGDDIMNSTMDWKGLRVMVKLTIINRQPSCEVIPTASALILRALKEPVRDRKKGPKDIVHDGNITMDDVKEVAREMRPKSMAREFAGTVKEILGTCFSIGCTVDGKAPRDVIAEVNEGVYDFDGEE